MLTCRPIGTITTPFDDPADVPRQGSLADYEGELILEPEYLPGLRGVEEGDRLDIVWFAHRADQTTIVLDNGDTRGVFATRSQDRPNPICITTCEVLDVAGERVRVSGVDMLDGTPVLDLKAPLTTIGLSR